MADTLDGDGVRAWIADFVQAFGAARVALDELDRRSGDGDFGSNLLPAVERVDRELAAAPAASVSEAFTMLSTAFMHAGGTSGPLFGVWFREFARAGAGFGGLDREALAAAAVNGLAAVQRLGQAGVGDKTMVDAMSPAADALASASGQSRGLRDDLVDAAAAARHGANATAGLIARRGRASYVGSSLAGCPTPARRRWRCSSKPRAGRSRRGLRPDDGPVLLRRSCMISYRMNADREFAARLIEEPPHADGAWRSAGGASPATTIEIGDAGTCRRRTQRTRT